MKKNIAVIVSGGKGTRMRSPISKQFMLLNGKPLITYAIEKFNNHEEIDEIVLVLPEEELDLYRETVMPYYNFKKLKALIKGGCTRQASVYEGLKALKSCDIGDIVLIHDGARPFVTDKIISEGIMFTKRYGAASCGVTPKDTIKVIDNNGFSMTAPDRSKLFAVQTPQCFKLDNIKKAHKTINEKHITVTDDTMAYEVLGGRVFLYEGDYKNIKITTPEDLVFAEGLLENRL